MRRRNRKVLRNSTPTHNSTEPRSVSEKVSDPEAYDCLVCGDIFSPDAGVIYCAEHFWCNECIANAFEFSVAEFGTFPVSCCGVIPYRQAEHCVAPDVLEKYKLKCMEYYECAVLKVYCADCNTFIPKTRFENHPSYTVAKCACGGTTCVGCKAAWTPDHLCDNPADGIVRPDWLPEYSSGCRIKRCPCCHMWIELKEACNHMTCSNCQHDFCFVCMLPGDLPHPQEGCPEYGDPVCGYDGEGYERSPRGLHRDTGLDSDGRNRLGLSDTD
ncbi:hypothetical protein P280DRAFT_400026, partial [Massarina eburnea CBS 473.64]